MDNRKIETTLKTLSEWSCIVYDNEMDFLEMFAKGDAWTLTEVGWNEYDMKIVYILGGGQHVCDSFKMTEWLRWMKRKTKKRRD